MNKLKGKIVRLESSDVMSIVEVDVKVDIFSAIVLETPQSADYLKIGREVSLLFKETEVSIAKNLSGLISLRNRFKAMIKKLEQEKILMKIILDYQGVEIISIISTGSAQRLDLKQDDEVEWLVKTNEISLSSNVE